ncbi:DUF2087 domain-containing protein [Paenibacillus caui]|uniref:DUF2087 domain-containing protein n=1 Tax=Paenibacillus caui TaxID=2873927 RepID=UPI001CAA074E|nr:DUF2087 domain-containing protein [Paenibacillus caui]
MDISERFWHASLEELKRGYIEDNNAFVCLLDGKIVEKGIVYPVEGLFYEAERYMGVYIEKTYGSVFSYLLRMDKKLTGLTDHQKRLLELFYEGLNDSEIKEAAGIGSTSTIRNHRFALKEKERQAKVFLTIMELLKEKDSGATTFIEPHKTARMLDDRYNVTEAEREKLLNKYFPDGTDGQLTTFAIKEKAKFVVLREISKRFDAGRVYTEKEINEIIKTVYEDYVTIRRYLIDYGFLDRKEDGSAYWLKA